MSGMSEMKIARARGQRAREKTGRRDREERTETRLTEISARQRQKGEEEKRETYAHGVEITRGSLSLPSERKTPTI